MKVTLYGAANEVTGSCFLLETKEARLLIDCGLFQGSQRLERLNSIPSSINARELDAVLLTHGHLDHCGRLPLLCRERYVGPIFATQGTQEIAQLVLNDAAKIQQDDVERENRKRAHNGMKPIKPLFEQEDVQHVIKQFRIVQYNEWLNVSNGVKAKFVEAGHILGSTSIELAVKESGVSNLVVFSGDIGQWNAPIVRDPARLEKGDLIFMESTYGDRDHRLLSDTVNEFEELIAKAVEKKGKILVPTFAVGRAQQILYFVAEMFHKGVVKPFPVYLDSPMAIAATALYAKHKELLDEEAQGLERSGQLRKDLATLHLCETADESRALNSVEGPCLILAGAGMCDAGRILHHLRHNLSIPETLVIIVGYQAKGSLGRQLIEGASAVKLFGETINVRATIRGLGGFSAHAGQSDLLRWLEPMMHGQPHVVLTHGESHQMNELAYQIEERFGIKVVCPKFGESVTI